MVSKWASCRMVGRGPFLTTNLASCHLVGDLHPPTCSLIPITSFLSPPQLTIVNHVIDPASGCRQNKLAITTLTQWKNKNECTKLTSKYNTQAIVKPISFCKIHMQIRNKDSGESISEHGTVIICCLRMVVRAVIMVPIVPMVP